MSVIIFMRLSVDTKTLLKRWQKAHTVLKEYSRLIQAVDYQKIILTCNLVCKIKQMLNMLLW